MVGHHPANFGGQRHCGIGDIMILVVEEQGFTCCLILLLLFVPKAHGMLRLHARNFKLIRTMTKTCPVRPIKKVDPGHNSLGNE